MEMIKKLLGAVALMGLLSFSAVQCDDLRPDQQQGAIIRDFGGTLYNNTGKQIQYNFGNEPKISGARLNPGQPAIVIPSQSTVLWVSEAGKGPHTRANAVAFDVSAAVAERAAPGVKPLLNIDVKSLDKVIANGQALSPIPVPSSVSSPIIPAQQ